MKVNIILAVVFAGIIGLTMLILLPYKWLMDYSQPLALAFLPFVIYGAHRIGKWFDTL